MSQSRNRDSKIWTRKTLLSNLTSLVTGSQGLFLGDFVVGIPGVMSMADLVDGVHGVEERRERRWLFRLAFWLFLL